MDGYGFEFFCYIFGSRYCFHLFIIQYLKHTHVVIELKYNHTGNHFPTLKGSVIVGSNGLYFFSCHAPAQVRRVLHHLQCLVWKRRSLKCRTSAPPVVKDQPTSGPPWSAFGYRLVRQHQHDCDTVFSNFFSSYSLVCRPGQLPCNHSVCSLT